MDVQVPVFVSASNGLIIDVMEPKNLGSLGDNVIIKPLKTVAHVRVLPDHPIALANIIIKHIEDVLDRLTLLTDLLVLIAVFDIGARCVVLANRHQRVLDNVLDFLYLWNATFKSLVTNALDHIIRYHLRQLLQTASGPLGMCNDQFLNNGLFNFRAIEEYDLPVAFFNTRHHGLGKPPNTICRYYNNCMHYI